MNSKERARAAFARQTPDRPPLGFFAIDSDTAARVLGRETYWRAKAKSQIAFWEGRRDEVVQSWIEDGIELYRKLDVIDLVPVSCMFAGVAPPKNYQPDPPEKIADDAWRDREGRVYKYSPQTQDISLIDDPLRWTRPHRVEDECWDGAPPAVDESIFEAVDALIAAFKDDRFVLGPCGGECAWVLLGGMERGLMELLQRPDDVKQIHLSRVARANAFDEVYVRPDQDGVLWGTDLACQHGPLLDPRLYRELFFEGYQERVRRVKQRGQTVVKHACGDNWMLLDIFAEAGVDCYQSIQESAGMDIVEVQRRYGDHFAVWGGVRVEHLFAGTPADVRRDVRRFMREVAPRGGCVLGTSHSVAVGVKYDNFMALLDEFSRWT